jgi:phage N-6-adenine-methyltransferase
MGKLLAESKLGRALKTHRKARGLTQGELAKMAGVAERTVWLLEQGKGTFGSFQVVIETLGLSISCRNVAEETLPKLLLTLRRRRHVSQDELARMVGVSRPTIRALEKEGTGRLPTLDRTLTVLGAGPYLSERGERKAFFEHAGNSSVGHRWETPRGLLEALYRVFSFDLDPCSPRKKGPVKARVRFTAEDDGLSLPWHGRVFVNPPYGRTLGAWIAKARSEFETGNAKTVVLLIPARTDTSYWHAHIKERATVRFLKGRLRFGDGNGDGRQSAPFPSALAIFGASEDEINALDRELRAWRG